LSRVWFQLKCPAQVRCEGEWYYSSCPPLDVHSQGRTEQEALANLAEALQLFVESCYERGTLEQVFKECGFTVDRDGPPEQEDLHWIDVPLSLVAQNAQARACAQAGTCAYSSFMPSGSLKKTA